jgi:hypothetical protein
VSNTTIQGAAGSTQTESISISRMIIPRWRAFGSYIKLDSPEIKQKVWIAVNEFRITSRLMVTQDFSQMDGDNTYSFGGQRISNRISLSAEQDVYVSPIAIAFGAKPIFLAWTFGIRVRLPRGASANLSTIVDPTGKVQWGGYMDGLKYRSAGPQHSDDSPSFSKYVVQGRVVDEATGLGLEGVALQIGKDIVLSDASGNSIWMLGTPSPCVSRFWPAIRRSRFRGV